MAIYKRAWRYLPAILCMLAIFIFSSRSGDQLDSVLPWVQKWLPWLTDFNPMHYVAFFILGLTVAFALGKLAGTWLGCLLNVAICTLYGITDEWHQAYVPMRSPDSLDLWHDAIGAGAASLLVLFGFFLNRGRNSRNYTGS
ncbi:VanZ family protein [Cohnella sp.]|uniref:VanZ family protein n=1 Tax=Cohnella sp. TaxID=1883426 RepID=UPI003567D897